MKCQCDKAKHFLLGLSVFLLTAVSGHVLAEDYKTLEIVADGLNEKVTIIKDRWGIPHIYANNQHDLFFAQGFNAARDRLFQLEMWRRRALGLLSEIQGEKAIEHDIGARLLKFRGDMVEELSHYHKDGDAIVKAFVDGVNAYIESARNNPSDLPIEFKLLKIKPGYWTPDVVISRHNALTLGPEIEVVLSEQVSKVGSELAENVYDFTQFPYLKPKPGVELSEISKDILRLYKASRNPPTFNRSDLAESPTNRYENAIKRVNTRVSRGEPIFDFGNHGSNNWVLSGQKTKSGYPILANDPHRLIETPSTRYWVHLVAPGWNVIGGGEPILPGISIGHNNYGAWGLTVFPIDQEDIYVYKLNPQYPDQYWYDGHWEKFEKIDETIPVKSKKPQKVTLKYSRHGPVLHEDKNNNKAYALRAAWLEKGAAPYLASLRIDQAKSWEEFREASSYSGLPGENMIWADREGNIGWQAVGFTPIRIGWDGLLPVPGDGRFEWAGFAPIKSMPHRLNPASGHWQSANHYNVPLGHPNIYSLITASPFRLWRIEEVLQELNAATISDSIALQQDVLSVPARTIVPLLLEAYDDSEGLYRRALDEFARWDFRLNQDSVAATLYVYWKKTLGREVANRLGLPSVQDSEWIRWMQEPANAPSVLFSTNPIERRNLLLISSFEKAVATAKQAMGPDLVQWRYDQYPDKPKPLEHPLLNLVDNELREKLSVGYPPNRGNEETVHLYVQGEKGAIGAPFAIVVDLSDWDLTVGSSAPGQSGNSNSPHYSDLFEPWSRGEYFPVYYSTAKINESATGTLTLIPLN